MAAPGGQRDPYAAPMSWAEDVGLFVTGLEERAGVQVRSVEEFSQLEVKADVAVLRRIQQQSATRALFAENDMWVVFWVLLYWEEIFSRLPGSFDPRLGSAFPAAGQDIPSDLFSTSFFSSHERLYRERRRHLERADLAVELKHGRQKSNGSWTRLLEDSDRFEEGELEAALAVLPAESVLRVLDRLWLNFNEYRRGLPDLLLIAAPPVLIEVKGHKDRLSAEQADWLLYLVSECSLTCEVLLIGWSERKLANVRKRFQRADGSLTRLHRATEDGPADGPSLEGGSAESVRSLLQSISEYSADAFVPEGVFWAEHVKTIRDKPPARLLCALQHRPLPAAYREAAVALRAMIRGRRKEGAPWIVELTMLYRVIVEASLLGTPYVEGLGPGFNAAVMVRRDTLDSLDFAYRMIGYERLGMGKTDIKWCVEAWGEPSTHRDPVDVYVDVWEAAVAAAKAKQVRDREAILGGVDRLLSETGSVESVAVVARADSTAAPERGEPISVVGGADPFLDLEKNRRSGGCASLVVAGLGVAWIVTACC